LHGELAVQTGEPLMRPVGRAVTYNWK
jgi:hypothetical protein